MAQPRSDADRVVGLREEMKELQAANLRYWAQTQRSPLDKSAHALRRERLLVIKDELLAMMKRAD